MNQTFAVVYQNFTYMVDPSILINSSRKFKELISNHNYDIQLIHLRLLPNKFSRRNVNNFLRICQNLPTDVQNSELFEICDLAIIFQSEKVYQTCLEFIQNNINSNFYLPYDLLNNDLIIESNENELDESYETSSKNNNKIPSACYQIQIEKTLMKRRRFYFIQNGKILFTAKQKDFQIFIGEGNDFHIKEMKKSAVITQSCKGYNIVKTDDQEFQIKYLFTNPNEFKKNYSMKLNFLHNNSSIFWYPKDVKMLEMLYGEYNHQPVQSNKNILLQNKAKRTTFIVRKMDNKLFEAECHSSVSPLIAFSIAISQIVGPYL